MDAAVFIKKLKDMFADVNKQDNRYSKIWLSEPEFARYLPSVRYVLNVKTKRHIDSTYPEIEYLFDLIWDKLKLKKNKYLFSIDVYNDNQRTPDDKSDIVLYDEEQNKD